MRALLASFLLSGLGHEILINVPILIFYKFNRLGSMMIYFTIQALGIMLERKLALRRNLLHRIYTLAFVIVPAPLFVHEGLLRVLGVWTH